MGGIEQILMSGGGKSRVKNGIADVIISVFSLSIFDIKNVKLLSYRWMCYKGRVVRARKTWS